MLRTNIADWSAEDLWRTYIQLTEPRLPFGSKRASWPFARCGISAPTAVHAHILVCFLAYVLWKTLEQWQQPAGLGQTPRTILEELQRIQSTDVVLPTEDSRELRLRCNRAPRHCSSRPPRPPRARPA